MTPPETPSPLALGSLHIHAFRGLQDVELQNPGRFNLLVGPNNTGKTSILEAISYFCRPADPVHWWRLGQKRLWFKPTSIWDAMLACFPKTQLPEKIVRISSVQSQHYTSDAFLKCNIRETIYQNTSRQPRRKAIFNWKATRIPPHAPYETLIDVDSQQEELNPISYHGPHIEHRIIDTIDHHLNDSYVYDWSELAGSPLQQEIIAMLQPLQPAILDFQNVVHREDDITELHAIHKTLGACSLSMFGDGFKRALAYALGLVHAKGGVLLIDEIEMAIHRSALERVYGWLRKMCEQLNVQVFATTHSLEAVEAMLGDHPSEDTVCYQLGEGGKVARRWSGDLLWRVVKQRGLDVR